ncbi:universal stress protein [Roseovarius nanhaiticus]|uniref:universal stress protein n=1 Tax=Roseovarius nanhaiticus TaxID=573024 RepID=UPI0024925571|nr:universal stress protein [Roseovarius nanhaiticus]
MYKNILVPVLLDDVHDHVKTREIAALAGPDAQVTLLHVIERMPTYVAPYIPENATAELRAELQRELDKLAKSFDRARGEVITGSAGRSITDYANKIGADLIVVESHRPGAADYFFGSTAGHVVRHATCAVHVLR